MLYLLEVEPPWKPTVHLITIIASCSQMHLQQILLPSQSGAVSQIHCFPDSSPGQSYQINHVAQKTASGWDKCTHSAANICTCFHTGTALPQMRDFMVFLPFFFPHLMYSTYIAAKSKSAGILSWKTNKQHSLKHTAGQLGILAFIPKVLLPVGLPAAATYQSITRSHHMNGFSSQLHVLHLVRAFDQFPLHFHCTSKSQVSTKPRATTIH